MVATENRFRYVPTAMSYYFTAAQVPISVWPTPTAPLREIPSKKQSCRASLSCRTGCFRYLVVQQTENARSKPDGFRCALPFRHSGEIPHAQSYIWLLDITSDLGGSDICGHFLSVRQAGRRYRIRGRARILIPQSPPRER